MATLNSIIWLVTGRCNLACSHCYAQRFSKCRELSPEEAESLVEEAASLGVRHIGLGGGEPLLRSDIYSLIRKAHLAGMTVSLVTNGTLVTSAAAQELERSKVSVVVSLDGAQPETHDRRRGPGTHAQALAAIAHLTAARASCRTVMALGQDNIAEVEEYLELARRLEVRAACLIPVMPSGRASQESVLTPLQLVKALERALEQANKLGLGIEPWCMPFAPLVDASLESHTGYCRTSQSMDLDPAGNVLLCDVLEEVISSVRAAGLGAAWEEQCTSSLIRRLERPNLAAVCSDCLLRQRCRGGCFARALSLSGDVNAPDPLCPRVAGVTQP